MAWASLTLHGQAAAPQAPPSPSSAAPATTTLTQSAPESGAQPLVFEVASVRLSPSGSTGYTSISEWGRPRFTATNATLQLLIEFAFDVSDDHIVGAPNWFGEQEYDIDAKVEGDRPLTYEQAQPLLQQLLKDRFHLAVRREMKDFPGYGLEDAKGGPKLEASKGSSGQAQIIPGQLRCPNCSMEALAGMLHAVTRRPVAEKTGIKGNFNIKLDYAPEDATDSPQPSIYTALQEQLGLKLIPQKVSAEVVVIDHVDKVPTEN